MRNRERGSFTVEAILALSMFMFAFMTIVSWALIAKVESTTQYAIDQVAKEVAEYYYIADKLGLIADPSSLNSKVEDVDNTIDAFLTFTNTASETADHYSDFSAQNVFDSIDVSGVRNDAASIATAAQAVYNSASGLMDDPVGILKAMASMMAQTAVNEVASRLITAPICKALMPRYITSAGTKASADEFLEKMGVVGGVDAMNFGLSSFLRDQRSINVVVVYELKVSGFGFFEDTLVIKQTASTAAWVKGKKLSEVYNDTSIWEDPPLDRGKEFVQDERGADRERGVKPGVGVDLYDQDTNTYTTVNSTNIFCASYATYHGPEGGEADLSNWEFNKSAIKAAAKRYCSKLSRDVDRIGDSITLADGTEVMTAPDNRNCEMVWIVPLEAQTDPDCVQLLNEIAQEIEADTGVAVTISYRELAFPNAGGGT